MDEEQKNITDQVEESGENKSSDSPQKKSGFTGLIFVVIVILIVGGYFFSKKSVSISPSSDSISVKSTDSGSVAPTGQVKEFTLTGSNFSFDVKEINVKAGDTVKVTFKNGEGMHDFVLDEFNVRTKVLKSGEEETVEFVANKVGTFEYYCSVGSHRKMGMVGKLIVQ